MTQQTHSLFTFLDQSPTSFHAVQSAREMLLQAGYQEYKENTPWHLNYGDKGFTIRNESAIAIFELPAVQPDTPRFSIALAHTDSPALKLKLLSAKQVSSSQIRIPIDVYGGVINNTWLDRPLGIAGRISFPDDHNSVCSVIVRSSTPVAVIPNAAISLNREVNNGFRYNPKEHLAAVVPFKSVDALLQSLTDIKLPPLENLGCDLFLFDAQGAVLLGAPSDSSKNDDALINSPRLDNLASCYAILDSLCNCKNPRNCIRVGFLTDNEEIGSMTYQGAHSSFLNSILFRISTQITNGPGDYLQMIGNSSMISIDAAHAVNPNFPQYHDPAYAPVLNGGIVIKENQNMKYSTTGSSLAHCFAICRQARIPWQRFAVPADQPCGSTIGPFCSALTGIPAADIGIAMWAMHSIRETAGLKDQIALRKFVDKFWDN